MSFAGEPSLIISESMLQLCYFEVLGGLWKVAEKFVTQKNCVRQGRLKPRVSPNFFHYIRKFLLNFVNIHEDLRLH